MRFNSYLANHFGSCRILARARDIHRGRDVTLHLIPGHHDVVGITDGVDAWLAPTAAAPFLQTATGNVAELMRKVQAGEPLPPVPEAARRPRVALDDEETPARPRKATRVAVVEEELPRRTRHVQS